MVAVLRFCTWAIITLGCLGLAWLSRENHRLGNAIDQLEADLGRLEIDDSARVHLLGIQAPTVPPEIAPHMIGIWRFRYYLPAGYDFIRMSGNGRVAQEGVFVDGGFSSSWGSPSMEPIHDLMTVSLIRKGPNVVAFTSFRGGASTTSWNQLVSEQLRENLVVETLATPDATPRSFNQDTILPLVRMYDSSTAMTKQVSGQEITTYTGAMIVVCPKSREQAFDLLKDGKLPEDFEPSWIAKVID